MAWSAALAPGLERGELLGERDVRREVLFLGPGIRPLRREPAGRIAQLVGSTQQFSPVHLPSQLGRFFVLQPTRKSPVAISKRLQVDWFEFVRSHVLEATAKE